MDGVSVIVIILFFFSLAAAAFFCSAETAFIGLQRLRLKHLEHILGQRARIVSRIMKQPEKFLATVLLMINFFESAVAALGTLIAVKVFGDENLGIGIAVIGITVLTLVFAELVPKSLAARHGERLALAYARPLEVVAVILTPFVHVLTHLGVRFSKLAEDEVEPRPTISEEEFRTAITVGEAEGVLKESEADMIHKVFEFGDRPVREAMTPRTEITFVEKGTRMADFIARYPESPHTRFPVFEETRDNVIGVLSIKDVLIAQAQGKVGEDAVIDELVRTVLFFPASKRLGEVLAEMQASGQQLAVIIDEFGGTAGVVTMEQLVEEIVGSIGDELVGGEKEYKEVGENTFMLDGGLRIQEANEELGIGLPEGDYETVAGLILHLLGHIPKEGEKLAYKGNKFVVSEMKGRKIERVLVTASDGSAAADSSGKAAAPVAKEREQVT